MRDAIIYDGIRSPRGRGRKGGALYEVRPVELLAQLLKALATRNELETARIDDVLIGCVTPVGGQGYNIAKAALLYADWSETVPGMQLNRYCASGLESVSLSAARIRAGWGELFVAGGVESMSRIPMGSDGGALLFDPDVINRTGSIPQGVAADLIASLHGIEREKLDALALESHVRADHARSHQYFSRSIIPVRDSNGLIILEGDETIRPNANPEQLAALKPAFSRVGKEGFDAIALHKYPQLESITHLHTAGNSSGIVDGASLVLLGSEEAGSRQGLKARARIRSTITISTDPTLMLEGPVPAAKQALTLAGMEKEDIDLWEVNEAFAVVPIRFQEALDLDPSTINVNGGAIAMGHPLGATGNMLLGTLLDELERRDLQNGLVSLCAGSGIGIAMIIERI